MVEPISPLDVILRENQPQDYRALCALLGAVFEEHRAHLDSDGFLAYLGGLVDGPSPAPGQILVAERAGLVVGTATYRRAGGDHRGPGPRGYSTVRALAVRPDWRRRGIGRLLLEACITRARADHAVAVCIDVPEAMAAGISFCRSLGFQEVPALFFDGTKDQAAGPDRAAVARAFCRRLIDAGA
jgi:GNAT superfamily N-acetyltransferase